MIHITKANKRRVVKRGPFTSRFLPLGTPFKELDDHGLAQIGRLEHATLEGGALVPMHMHQNEEILSYLRRGTMHHKDSDGNDLGIHNKHFMLMNAGSGIYHEEGVLEGEETVEMLQIFIRPKADGLEPRIQFLEPEETSSLSTWRLLAGHERSKAPMIFRSEVLFYDVLLKKGKSLETPDLSGKIGLLYVFHGSAVINNSDVKINKGDSIVIKDEQLNIKSHDDADLVFFVLDEIAPFSRNGLFAK